MSEPIDPSEDGQNYPHVLNGPIAPAADDEDAKGWHKNETWVMNAQSSGACGDQAIGPYYQASYWKREDDHFVCVEESYYIEAWQNLQEDGTWRKHFDVTGMYQFTTCTDRNDPGMTEIGTETQYDDDIHAEFIWDYEKARALAERMAISDQRFTLT